MKNPLFVVVIAAATLVLGIVVGYFIGRWSLDREQRQPLVIVGADDQARSAANDADPTPKAGSKVLRRMALSKSREAIEQLTAKDPLVVRVGAVGRGDEGAELHLMLENKGTCEVVSYEGIAYGFDAWARPAKMNRRGEHYIAFASNAKSDEDAKIAAKAKGELSQKVRYVDTASIALAQIDKMTCADGTTWARQ